MKTKYELNIYSVEEFQKLERHLEKMAANGWMLKKMGQFFISYEEQEPKNVHFSVVFFPKTHVLTPEPSEDLLMLREFCERTGWKLAGEVGQMQVFYNESANPTPIETEAWVQVKNIHETAKKNIVLPFGLLLFISVMQTGMQIMNFRDEPLEWLSQGTNQGLMLLWFTLGVGYFLEIIYYFIWYWRAKGNAEREGVLLEARSKVVLRLLYVGVAILGIVYTVLSLMKFTSPKYGVVIVLWSFVMVAVPFVISRILKFEKVSVRANIIITCVVSLMASFFMMVGIVAFVVNVGVERQQAEPKIMIELDEITELEKEVRVDLSESDSVFLTKIEIFQSEEIEIKKRHTLNCWIYKIKTPFIYDFCKEKLLGGLEQRYRGSVKLEDYGYERVDMPIWKANEVYCCYEEGEPTELYALFYDDMMVQILVGWDFTEEEIIKIRDILVEVE